MHIRIVELSHTQSPPTGEDGRRDKSASWTYSENSELVKSKSDRSHGTDSLMKLIDFKFICLFAN